MKFRLGINGFGRIGRCFLKAALKDKEFKDIVDIVDIVAINDLSDATTLAHLFKYDSVFGRFDGDIQVIKNNNNNSTSLIIDGFEIKVISEKDPRMLPWKDLKVDIVLESSGKFNDAKEAVKHIHAGAKKS